MDVPFRQEDHRRLALFFDGLRYSFRMALIASERLASTLDDIAALRRKDEHSEDQVVSALLDAWCIIDVCQRIRKFIEQLPQLPRKESWVKRFLVQTAGAEDLRHHVQHLIRSANNAENSTEPIWGALTWIPLSEPDACYTIFSGYLLPGHAVDSISYDTLERRYTAQTVISAAGVRVDVGAIARSISELRNDLTAWVRSKPNTTVAEGKTLVWKWSVLGGGPEHRLVQF